MKKIAKISLLCLLIASCINESDEAILRREFLIPPSAKTIYYNVYPEKPGFFGREGLRIDIAFQFDERSFQKYFDDAKKGVNWLELPIPEDFLMKMLGIKSTKEGIIRSYKESGKALPEEGSIYNPTLGQLFESALKSVELPETKGLFQCRTAGDDIMHKKKEIKLSLEKDLIDFILAILDTEKKQLIIKVRTKY
uniref:Lipoprotein n=1 Tax=candidate division WOR-3 bacterium TaxID=2052148 RepID=A0A7V0Z3K0_UNCW3